MSRKTLIDQNINRHTKELEESLKYIMPNLIAAFIKVYGEKYREHITYTIESLEYIFFISEGFTESIIETTPDLRKSTKRIMIRYLAYINEVSYKYSSVSYEDEQKYIISKFLPRFPYPCEEYEYYADVIEEDTPCCMAKARKDNITLEPSFTILLPIFTIDLKIIIHEINHALGSNPLFIIDDNYMFLDFQFKKEIPEELVNDFIAELVLQEYLKNGGIVSKPLRRMRIGNIYKEKDYILKYFFDQLKPLILDSRISGDFNKLYELIGSENIDYLCSLMIDLYKEDNIDKYIELIKLINQIMERLANLEIASKDAIISRLEKEGLKLRILKK